MKAFLLSIAIIVFTSSVFAQEQKVDFSKAGSDMSIGKSIAELLQETSTQPAANNNNYEDQDLSKKYKADMNQNSNSSFSTTLTSQQTSPNNFNFNADQPAQMNATQYQQQVGGVKTNSTVITDQEGKVRSSSTTIKLGNK